MPTMAGGQYMYRQFVAIANKLALKELLFYIHIPIVIGFLCTQ